jgi:hypothetical protein
MRKKRIKNIRLIIARRSYSTSEIATLLEVHPRTIQMWHKEGMIPIEENTKPFLFMGYEIKRFLSDRRSARRVRLKGDEFFCPRCKVARKSAPRKIKIINTGKKIGRGDVSVLIKGICIVCGCKLNRFSTKNRSKTLSTVQNGKQRRRILEGDLFIPLNNDIEKDDINEK